MVAQNMALDLSTNERKRDTHDFVRKYLTVIHLIWQPYIRAGKDRRQSLIVIVNYEILNHGPSVGRYLWLRSVSVGSTCNALVNAKQIMVTAL